MWKTLIEQKALERTEAEVAKWIYEVGVTAEELRSAELELQFDFPKDLKELYSETDGLYLAFEESHNFQVFLRLRDLVRQNRIFRGPIILATCRLITCCSLAVFQTGIGLDMVVTVMVACEVRSTCGSTKRTAVPKSSTI
tara:strand:- start:1832 stop:2251 length:420 start_codon:yes stop_codon:yes gene_type:complete